ncbi:S1C family serine protease [Leucobacter massiliensis]|uniref:Protease n=1 Tax=Leucobacter massiliensis TaxID=1686285 RepID=A0A2S9QMS0_9MICO|nr:trypsin-like peptidase domain-containing protein [Leucobacter massiliensis]PRI10891.1 protease [Leucobacter massiliensis]
MTNTPEYDQQGSQGASASAGGADATASFPPAAGGAAPQSTDGTWPQAAVPGQQPTQPTVPLPGAGAAHDLTRPAAAQQPHHPDPAQHSGYPQTEQQPYPVSQPAPHGHPQQQAPGHDSGSHLPQHQFASASQQPLGAEHPHTVPHGLGAGAHEQDHRHQAQPKSRAGALLAGLAAGALIGGVVGGGVAAVVASNIGPQSNAAGGGGSITLNNAENATAISGVAAVATPSVVTLEVSSSSAAGSGSGVIFSEDGYIVTNAHVVTLDGAAEEGATIRVKLSDGRIFDGELVGVDPYADLAVVKIDADGLTPIKVADSDKLDVGDLTVAIGAPLNLPNTVTSGVVSALNRGISVGSPLIPQNPSTPDDGGQGGDGGEGGDGGNGFPWDFRFGLPDEQQQPQQSTGGTVTLPVIQTDASINPGNSGGALLNGNGELIGINVAIASTAASGETAGSVGLGFAIPSNLASRVAEQIIAGEQPSHGLLGASVGDSSQDTDADANVAGGLLVDVTRGGAADKAGLRAGDVITAVDGVPAVDGTSVSALIRLHPGDSKVTIDYSRDGRAGQTEATLGTLEW